MKVPEPEDTQPVSWLTIRAETPVFSVDEQEVGSVHEVLGSEQADIFHGIVVQIGSARQRLGRAGRTNS